MIVFDIETGALPMDDLKKILPGFDSSTIPHPGEFDPSSVKCGNIGGPESEKGKAKTAEARAKHADDVASYQDRLVKAESTYWMDIESKAALSAITGSVMAIGYMSEKAHTIDHVRDHSEKEILKRFWQRYDVCRKQDRPMVGFNIKDFDVPFIAQRSLILGVSIPSSAIQSDRYLCKTFVDLRDRWGFGQYRPSGTLDVICRACGIQGKPDGVDGSMFSKLFVENFDAAIDYLKNDLRMEFDLANAWLG